jgi:hypothetical protein
VCKKEGCWSSNHSKEEQEESRKKFKARFSQRFDKYTRQYIVDYEGTENNDDDLDSIDEDIEALIVTDDYSQEDLEPAKHFTTSFSVLEPERAFDITTTLANQSLVHALTCTDTATSDTTTSADTDSDPFIYTVTSRYTSSVFYGIIRLCSLTS